MSAELIKFTAASRLDGAIRMSSSTAESEPGQPVFDMFCPKHLRRLDCVVLDAGDARGVFCSSILYNVASGRVNPALSAAHQRGGPNQFGFCRTLLTTPVPSPGNSNLTIRS